jgi:hypothetical protein
VNTSITEQLANLLHAKDFLKAIDPMLPAYRFGILSYVAVVHEGTTAVLRARLDLSMDVSESTMPPLTTAHLSAGQIKLSTSPETAETWIRSVVSGDWLPVVEHRLLKLLPRVPLAYSDGYSAYYEPPSTRMQTGYAIQRLTMSGINRDQIIGLRYVEIDRELAVVGIDSVNELMQIYGLRGSGETTLEITTGPVSVIDKRSRLDGRRAVVSFSLARALRTESFGISVRSAGPKSIGPLSALNGQNIEWGQQGDKLLGLWEFDLPKGDVIDCRATYAGRVQEVVRLSDLRTLPNPRRAVLGLVDPELKRLMELLTRPTGKQRDDFESAVALLLQMLGFAPMHIGAMSGWNGEPDILVSCPSGDVLLVECTTGAPDDEKVSMLVSRRARMREDLLRTQGETVSDVIAILVTSLPIAELEAVRRKSDECDVLLLCNQDLEWAISRSEFHPMPEAVLQHWRSRALTSFLARNDAWQLPDM